MSVKIEPSWEQRLGAEFDKPYFHQLCEQVRQEYQKFPCYPPGRLIFNAFNLCPFEKVKVVIIGQDPYHEPGQAMGLSFSVPEARSSSAQCYAYGSGTCCKQSSTARVGHLHGCCYQGFE